MDESRKKFFEETGTMWENSQGEPDIDYVIWLEALVEKLLLQTRCDLCGKGGDLIVKHYHRDCHEAVLNGEGMI